MKTAKDLKIGDVVYNTRFYENTIHQRSVLDVTALPNDYIALLIQGYECSIVCHSASKMIDDYDIYFNDCEAVEKIEDEQLHKIKNCKQYLHAAETQVTHLTAELKQLEAEQGEINVLTPDQTAIEDETPLLPF